MNDSLFDNMPHGRQVIREVKENTDLTFGDRPELVDASKSDLTHGYSHPMRISHKDRPIDDTMPGGQDCL